MALDNSIDHLEDDLVAGYVEAKARWKRDHPQGPWPELNETLRNQAVQTAYYARSRQPVKEVQRLYAAAGLYAIDAKEASEWNTNAQYGQSAHNARKGSNKARAYDVRMRKLVLKDGLYVVSQEIIWNDNALYEKFAGYVLTAAKLLLAAGKIKRATVWGGDFNGNGKHDDKCCDMPHFQLAGWQDMK